MKNYGWITGLVVALLPLVAAGTPEQDAQVVECNTAQELCELVCQNPVGGAFDADVEVTCLVNCGEQADGCRSAASR